MNTKEIVKTIENLTGLYFEISVNDNQTEVASTFNPEKINHEYFNICNELESYFTELYLDSNNLILERILYLLNNGLKFWNRLKKESFNINLNFENKELKNLETKLTDAELLRIAEIKTHYIQNLISRIENLTVTPIVKALPPQPIKTKQPTEKKTLSDLITHQKSVEIVEGIKIQYKNIKGKRLKLLLLALQELNLLPKERIAKKFYNCCKAEFGWDVASYTAMNDYQFNEYTDKIELDNMKKFLEKIIQTK